MFSLNSITVSRRRKNTST